MHAVTSKITDFAGKTQLESEETVYFKVTS